VLARGREDQHVQWCQREQQPARQRGLERDRLLSQHAHEDRNGQGAEQCVRSKSGDGSAASVSAEDAPGAAHWERMINGSMGTPSRVQRTSIQARPVTRRSVATRLPSAAGSFARTYAEAECTPSRNHVVAVTSAKRPQVPRRTSDAQPPVLLHHQRERPIPLRESRGLPRFARPSHPTMCAERHKMSECLVSERPKPHESPCGPVSDRPKRRARSDRRVSEHPKRLREAKRHVSARL
jgi:hypothetical protein